MKGSLDPTAARDGVKALGVALRAEQLDGCHNAAHDGGLDAFLFEWSTQYPAAAQHAEVTRLLSGLRGYYSWDQDQRDSQLGGAITTLRQLYVALGQPVEAPPAEVPTEPTPKTSKKKPATATGTSSTAKPKTKAATDKAPANAPITLDSPLEALPGVGKVNAQAFRRLGVRTIRDLLQHYPFRYDDFSKRTTISELRPGQLETVVANVVDIRTFSMRSGGNAVEIKLEDETGILKAVFYRQPWLARQVHIGMQIMLSGKVELYAGQRQMNSPDWQPFQALSPDEMIHVGRLVPVHPLTKGLAERSARTLIKQVVDRYASEVADPLPPEVRQRAGLIDLASAIAAIHFPRTAEDIVAARTRLGFDEFLAIQLGVLQRKIAWQREDGYAIPYNDEAHQAFLSILPFALTNAQTNALGEIFADMGTPVPRARLLQGDVGSGKTAVAAATALQAVANGFQAAIMAPTEILAEQHYRGLRNLLGAIQVRRSREWQSGIDDAQRSRLAEIQQLLGMDPQQSDGVRVALLTGSLGAKERRRVLEGIANGEVDLIVGTHALITESVQYHRLGIAIVDEQHRFGVEQRQKLKDKGHNPHLLVMTATPIPRTLTMTIYGDLDTSILNELPPGRQVILTKRIRLHERERAYKHMRKEISAGRQAFVVCPLVEESEKSDLPSAEEMHVKLQTEVFPDLRVTLIHGKMSPKDKDAVMLAFRNHEYDILVATAVIEVGIDIPNATTMMIEGADRFGLAQLHQFRGRVGRGQHKSYCILVSDRDSEVTTKRLGAMEETRDGFRLAEIDLELRGPGEFFGTRQSGTPDLKIAQLTDTRLLHAAQLEAKTILRDDPALAQLQHALLKAQVEAFWSKAVESN